MENKEIIESIIQEESLDNISLDEETFTVKLGDILNEDTEGNCYFLLDSYLEIPYSFSSTSIKFHRGIIDVLETDIYDNNAYSGFVHYHRSRGFCYGESGVDYICNTIRDEGLTSDRFIHLLMTFNRFLAFSSHKSISEGSYKKLDLPEDRINTRFTIKDFVNINGINYPSSFLKIYENVSTPKIDYDSPPLFLHELPNKSFSYLGETIVPKLVEHKITWEQQETAEELLRIDVSRILKEIEKATILKTKNEISNKRGVSLQDFFHKLSDKQCRVDGSIYI